METKGAGETCWFCGRQRADDTSGAVVEMHRHIKGSDTEFQTLDAGWEPHTVYVPRCVSCKAVHDRTEGHVQRGWLVGLPAGVVLGLLTYIFLFRIWWIVPGVVFGVAMLAGIAAWRVSRAFSPKEVRDQGDAKIHPDVRRKEEEGWELGAKPIGRA